MVAYTPAEYGVRKDDGLGMIKPYNSSGGLLFLAILMSACVGGLIYALVRIAVEGTWDILGRVWWAFLILLLLFIEMWRLYFKERRTEELRDAHNLPRPVE